MLRSLQASRFVSNVLNSSVRSSSIARVAQSARSITIPPEGVTLRYFDSRGRAQSLRCYPLRVSAPLFRALRIFHFIVVHLFLHAQRCFSVSSQWTDIIREQDMLSKTQVWISKMTKFQSRSVFSASLRHDTYAD